VYKSDDSTTIQWHMTLKQRACFTSYQSTFNLSWQQSQMRFKHSSLRIWEKAFMDTNFEIGAEQPKTGA